MTGRLRRLLLVLGAVLFVVPQLLAAPVQATGLTPGQIAHQRTIRYWEMRAQSACAFVWTDPVLPSESTPFAYRECVRQWLQLNAPGFPW